MSKYFFKEKSSFAAVGFSKSFYGTLNAEIILRWINLFVFEFYFQRNILKKFNNIGSVCKYRLEIEKPYQVLLFFYFRRKYKKLWLYTDTINGLHISNVMKY